jgi:hypothetical protein
MQEIIDQATEAHPIPDTENEDSHFNMEEQQAFYINRDARRLALAEIKRRVALLADCFGMKWPENEDDWLELIFDAFERCEAPGFKVQAKTAGAPEKWSDRKNAQLFADVMSVVATQKTRSEYAAVKHIVDKPTKFLNRYSKYKVKTLHRQFLRAKDNFEEQFDDGLAPRGAWFKGRDDAIRYDVEHYSAEAERKRRGPVAKK